jgi:uncharacterized flavoprotein (TIGR03862 family)
MSEKIIIVGGGPAGLFCAYQLLERKFEVDLYDQMSGLGKKFLVAGNGGLNLTHSEDIELFCQKYGENQKLFTELISEFTPNDLRSWCNDLGVNTFIGTSGRVFPEKLKAAEILLKWIEKLKSYDNFHLFLKHSLQAISNQKVLSFQTDKGNIEVQADTLILALGGASWSKTGSDGKWSQLLKKLEIDLRPFQPMNCGFERKWSEHFVSKVDRAPLKNILIKACQREVRGEAMLTPFGIEGSAIYALSHDIGRQILESGSSKITLNLKPDLNREKIIEKLSSKKSKESFSNHLRKSLGLEKEVIVLIRELSDSSRLEDWEYLADKIQALELELTSIRPIDEAISTSGGVCFSGLTKELEVVTIPKMYIVGEMLDFEAPTGGYLLQGCFSSAWRVVKAISED